MIKIAICEDQKLMLKGLESLLKEFPDLDIVGLHENGQLLLNAIRATSVVPDVVLMDIDMPVLSGFETTAAIRTKYPNTKVIILSSHIGTTYVENAIRQGAHGYLPKASEPDEIHGAIHEAHKNGFYFNQLLSFSRLQEFIVNGSIKPIFDDIGELSRREVEVVRGICEEKTTAQIAEELNLGENTVNSYRQNIMTKIGTKKVVGIVIYALKNGIYHP